MTESDKAVMQQALAALECCSFSSFCEAVHHGKKDRHDMLDECPVYQRHKEAIFELQEAIAQPEQTAPSGELTNDEIIRIAKRTKTAEPGCDGYILPISFARAVIAAIAQPEQQAVPNDAPEVHYTRGYGVALSDAEEAIDDECRERVVTASDCIELIRNLGAAPHPEQPAGERELTDEAKSERDDWKREADNCSCHISAPCGCCTRPGNPMNQEEDETAWKPSIAQPKDKP